MPKHKGIRYSFVLDRTVVVIAYVLAIAGGWIAILGFADMEVWMKIGIADFTATVIIFIFSLLLNNSSMYDPYWSVLPIIILLYLVSLHGLPMINLRMLLICIVVCYWGVRLTANWLRTWPGLDHEDWRYSQLARDTGRFYWPVSFLGIHLLPTVLVFAACLPLLPIAASTLPLQWTDLLGFIICLSAVELERRADNQLAVFKSSNRAADQKICDAGLWHYSRHPNYFGEISFWGGIYIMALGLYFPENIVYGIGFLGMVLLFVFVSIPMMEKRQMTKPDYAQYRQAVSMLVPWFRNKNNHA